MIGVGKLMYSIIKQYEVQKSQDCNMCGHKNKQRMDDRIIM